MTYDEYISLIDFLNDRLRRFRNPWYTWAIDISWEKLQRWGERLGWNPDYRWPESVTSYLTRR